MDTKQLLIENCDAVITGASSGLGEEFARQLAPIASGLFLIARRRDRLALLAEDLRVEYPNLRIIYADVDLGADDACDKILSFAHEQGFLPSLLINNAGLGDVGDFQSSEIERVHEMLAVNIMALTELTYHLLKPMRVMGFGGILNVSSVASLAPLPQFAVYAASKAYVTSFSEALRLELLDCGVHVSALCPGPVRTEFREVATRVGEENKSASKIQPLTVNKEEVVAAGLRGIFENIPRVYPGTKLKALAHFIEFTPPLAHRILVQNRND